MLRLSSPNSTKETFLYTPQASSEHRVKAAKRSRWAVFIRRFLIPAVVGGYFIALAIAFVFPFYWMLVSSIKPVQDIFSLGFQLIPQRVTFDSYVRLMSNYPFLRWYLNSVGTTVAFIVLSLLLASMAGFALAKYRFWGSRAVILIILASTMIPIHLKLIPLFLMLNSYGLLNTYAGVVLPGLAPPFMVFFLRQFMLSLDGNLLDAGRIDGASEWRLYWNIALPLSKPALSAIGVLSGLFFWNDLLWPLVVLRTRDMFPLSVGLASITSTYRPQFDLVMAGSVLSIAPFFILYLFARKAFTTGLAISSGMKG